MGRKIKLSNGDNMQSPRKQDCKGRFIVFEGVDAVGKTTLSEDLFNYLSSKKIPVRLCRFPGTQKGTLGELIYRVHHSHESEFGIEQIEPCALQLLHISAHIDTIEQEIKPALDNGEWIILDRFWWSTYVYGVDSGVSETSLHNMIEIEKSSWNSNVPDILFLIDSSQPMRDDELNSQAWQNKRKIYHELSRKENTNYKCIPINNFNSEEGKHNARQKVICTTAELIK